MRLRLMPRSRLARGSALISGARTRRPPARPSASLMTSGGSRRTTLSAVTLISRPASSAALHQLAAGRGRARCRSSGPCRGSPSRRRRRRARARRPVADHVADRRPRSRAGRLPSMMSQRLERRRASRAGCRRRWSRGCPGLNTPSRAAADDAGADRHARAEALGERHHVGLDAGVLVREPLAGAADAALHLVEHEQPAACVADLAQAAQVVAGARR